MNAPQLFLTDVFTDRRYGGNQLASLVDCASLSDAEMQQIAREINFSETTFITSREPRNGGYDVRIFTPKAEIEFAGHPTLGTAHVIRNVLNLTSADEVILNLRVGQIPVRFVDDVLWMKQMPPQFGKQFAADQLAEMLGLALTDIDATLPIEEVSTGFPTIIVPLNSMDALKRTQVNKERSLAFVKDSWAKVILVFCREGYEPGQALGVRMFADYYGVSEDPATGSSNGCLAAYLAQHCVLGSTEIDVKVGQGYEVGRPSTLMLRTRQTAENVEVFVGGGVVDVARGAMEEKIATEKSVGKKITDYVFENPITTVWNLILLLGGIFLLIFFQKIHYLPQVELSSITGVLAAVALIGLMLLLTLLVIPMLPGIFFKYMVEQGINKKRSLLLSWALGMVALILVLSLIGEAPKVEVLAAGAAFLALASIYCLVYLEMRWGDFLGHIVIGALVWLFSLIWVTYILLASPQLNESANDVWIALVGAGLIWLCVIIFANLALFVQGPQNNQAAVWIMAAGFLYVTILVVTPSKISVGAIRLLGLGEIREVSVLVSQNACRALAEMDQSICKLDSSKTIGVVKQVDIVSRIGGEYLLDIPFPANSQRENDKQAGEQARKLRVLLKKDDVLTYIATSPTELRDSDKRKQ